MTNGNDSLDDALALQVHLAEYAALSNRTTYWIAIQASTWPTLLIYLTLLAGAHGIVGRSTLAWLMLSGAQLIAVGWYVCSSEIFDNVQYIETELRASIGPIIRTKEFWTYERFKESERGADFVILQFAFCSAAVLATCTLAILFHRSRYDILWIAINVIFSIYLVHTARVAASARKKWQSLAQTLPSVTRGQTEN
ncbi:MAG: hypothetical protein ACRD3Q_02675 [Terriglobales bacterium]